MNANVVGGVGGEDEGSLPQRQAMPQALTETVYLGRASFRITHEIETVSVEEPSVDSSTWFARDSVILQGGPNMMDRLTETGAEPGWGQVDPGPRRWFKRSWLMVAVPVAAFALGLLVAQLAGSSARSASRHVALAARTTVPPAIPPKLDRRARGEGRGAIGRRTGRRRYRAGSGCCRARAVHRRGNAARGRGRGGRRTPSDVVPRARADGPSPGPPSETARPPERQDGSPHRLRVHVRYRRRRAGRRAGPQTRRDESVGGGVGRSLGELSAVVRAAQVR